MPNYNYLSQAGLTTLWNKIKADMVTVATNQAVTGIKTFNAPSNVSGTEQATTTFKTANGGQIIFGKEGSNSGTMIALDQVAGTRRLNFRASATPGAIVWSQPESGSMLYMDVNGVNFRQTSTILFSKFLNAGYLYTDASGYLRKGTLATVATSGSYNDLSDKPTIPTTDELDERYRKKSDVLYWANVAVSDESATNTSPTFDGVTANTVSTGTNASNYFQCQKFRGEGDASTYYHAIDFGYANHDHVDFYEYGGVWNFWKNTTPTATSDASNRVASLQLGKLVERGNTLTYPGKSGTIALTDDLGTAASKNTGTSSGNVPIIGTDGKLPQSILPAAAITDTFVVNSQAAMLALNAQVGDVCVRSDLSKTYILQTEPASTLENWQELLSPGCDVTSVNGHTGAVKLVASDVGAVATNAKYANKATSSGNTLTITFGDGTSSSYTPSFTYSDIGAQPAGNYIKYTSSTQTVAGTSKTVSKTDPATLYVSNGLIMGGTAASAGLVTRGICGVSVPDSNGACTKDNLYLNYDSDTNYSRKVILGAGSVGTAMTGGAYTYCAVRGDQMASYVAYVTKDMATTSTAQTITGAKTFTSAIKADELDNSSGNALVRYKSTEGKNVFGGVNYPAVLMGSADRPYYSNSGSDFTGSEIALVSDLASYVTTNTVQTITADKTFTGNATMKNLTVNGGFSHTGGSVAVFNSGTSSPSPSKTYFFDDGTNLQTLLDAKQNKITADTNLSLSDDTLSVVEDPAFQTLQVNDDNQNFPSEATSPFGEDTDIDTTYYAKGIACLNANSESYEAVLSFPKASGTIALTSDIKTYTAGTNITISDDGVISATGGGSSYTAGSYISISDGIISNTFAGTETGTNSTATHGAKSGGTTSVGIGYNANAAGASSIAIGGNAAATYIGGCVAIGYNSKASKSSAMALGYLAEASGQYSEAIGYDATASGTSSIAIGKSASATATGAVSIGPTAGATLPYQISFPHVQFLTVADLSSSTYTIPTGYTCLLFSAGMFAPTTVYAGSTIGKGSTYTGGYLAIVFKVS